MFGRGSIHCPKPPAVFHSDVKYLTQRNRSSLIKKKKKRQRYRSIYVKFCYKPGGGGGGAIKKSCDVLEVKFGDKLQ
jgi:hypothetical protein